MDNITKLIANFSDRNRIKFEDNRLTITSLGNKKHDFIMFGSFCIVAITIWIICCCFNPLPIIYIVGVSLTIVGISFIIYYLLSKGDNIVCFDFMNMEVTIKRRSPIFKMIPSRSVLFRNVNRFATNTIIDVGESSDMISHDVYLEKNTGVLKQIVLIRFDKAENNSAKHFLEFLKKSITGT